MSVVEQEKIDKLMLDMDGTDNKCKLPSQMNVYLSSLGNVDCANCKDLLFHIAMCRCTAEQCKLAAF